MSGFNLHSLVRALVGMVHPEETVTLYRSAGQANVKGQIKPKYHAPLVCSAQVQAVSDAALSHADKVGQNDITRHFYLDAPEESFVGGVNRPLAKGGDILQRQDGNWWLVTAMPEDFSAQSGWACVRGTLQTIAPDFSFSDWWEKNV